MCRLFGKKRGKKMMKGSILDHWREPSFIGIVDDLSPELLSHTPREQWALFFQKRSLLCKDELIISYAKRVHSGGGSQSFNYQQIVLLKANDQDLLLGILDRKNVVRIFITLKWAWVCDLLLMNPPCIMLHDPRFLNKSMRFLDKSYGSGMFPAALWYHGLL